MGYTIAFFVGVATGALGPFTVHTYRKLRREQFAQAYPPPAPSLAQMFTPPVSTPGSPVLSRASLRNVPGRRRVRRNGPSDH